MCSKKSTLDQCSLSENGFHKFHRLFINLATFLTILCSIAVASRHLGREHFFSDYLPTGLNLFHQNENARILFNRGLWTSSARPCVLSESECINQEVLRPAVICERVCVFFQRTSSSFQHHIHACCKMWPCTTHTHTPHHTREGE